MIDTTTIDTTTIDTTTSDIAAIPGELGLSGTWEQKNGSHWLASDSLDVRRMASLMLFREARFVTVSAMELPDDGGIRLDYHWDVNGELLTFTLKLDGKMVPSIHDLCPAADWIEREIHEYFAVDFEGREYEPLLLRTGDPAGVNLHKEDK